MAGSIKVAGHELIRHDIANDKLVYGSGVPAGCTLQVKSTTKTDHWGGSGVSTGNAGLTPYAVTGLAVSITPKFSSSNILLFADIFMGSSDFQNYNFFWSIYRNINGTGFNPIGVGNDSNASQFIMGGQNFYPGGPNPFNGGASKNYLDSPNTTSAITYQIYVGAADLNPTLYVNRTGASSGLCGVSTITAMEISA